MNKKITMVFDTETANGLMQPLIYDLGLTITDRTGDILLKKRFLVKEIFENVELMASAYYADKIETHYQGLDHLIKPFGYVVSVIRTLIKQYKVTTIAAFNLEFDMRAMAYTYMQLIGKTHNRKMIWTETKSGKFRPDNERIFKEYVLKEELDLLCIWSYACEVVLSSRNYQRVAVEEGWMTSKGNYLTNAEVTYRYLTGVYDFIETHTALHDAEIETFILFECERKKKAHLAGILFHPWRLVQK